MFLGESAVVYTDSVHERKPHPSLTLNDRVNMRSRPFVLLSPIAPCRHIFHPWVQNSMVILMLVLCIIQDNVIHIIILSLQKMKHPIERRFLRETFHPIVEVKSIQQKDFH